MSNLSRVGFGGDHLGGMNFENVPHPTMHASTPRQVLNIAHCELCNEEFMPDSSGSTICSRSLCRAVRTHLRKKDNRGGDRRPVSPVSR